MGTTSLNSKWRAAMLLLLVAATGCCCHAIPLPDEQQCCRTDARRLYWGCGEEAVRRGPCGPDSAFYGHKPTEWRSWPDGWHLGQHGWGANAVGACGEAIDGGEYMEGPADQIMSAFEEPFGADAPVQATPEAIPVPTTPAAEPAAEGPFRDDPAEAPFPALPPVPLPDDATPPEAESNAPPDTTPDAAAPDAATPGATTTPAAPPVEAQPMSNRVQQHVHQNLAL